MRGPAPMSRAGATDRGEEIPHRTVEPSQPIGSRPRAAGTCCAASRPQDLEKHPYDRARISGAEGAGGDRVSGAARAGEDEGENGTAVYLMAFVDGRVLWDPALAGLKRGDRAPGV
jgi:hypothetical protein